MSEASVFMRMKFPVTEVNCIALLELPCLLPIIVIASIFTVVVPPAI